MPEQHQHLGGGLALLHGQSAAPWQYNDRGLQYTTQRVQAMIFKLVPTVLWIWVSRRAGLPNTQTSIRRSGACRRYSRLPMDCRAASHHPTPIPTPLTSPNSNPARCGAPARHCRSVHHTYVVYETAVVGWWCVAMQLLMKEGRGRGAGGL